MSRRHVLATVLMSLNTIQHDGCPRKNAPGSDTGHIASRLIHRGYLFDGRALRGDLRSQRTDTTAVMMLASELDLRTSGNAVA